MNNPELSSKAVSDLAFELGRELTPAQASQVTLYLEILTRWNRQTNLVGPRGWSDILSQLVADSWHLADFLDENFELLCQELSDGPLCLDFGAGAGLPGVPLRIFWEAGSYYLIEPRRKRAGFLRQVAAELRLARTKVFEGTSEQALKRPAWGRSADLCLSRAFLPWREFLELSRKFLRPGGFCLVMAGSAGLDGELPQGFVLRGRKPYAAGDGQRGLELFQLI